MGREPALRVLLVDDHPAFRRGVKDIIADGMPGALFGEATDAAEAMERVRAAEWDVVIVDLTLPGRNGIELLRDIREVRPRLPSLVLTMHPPEQYAMRVLRAGASGYVTKECAADELVHAIRRVLEGRKYLPSPVAEQLATDLSSPRPTLPHERLSDREFEIMTRIAAGNRLCEIASRLSLSAKTVSTYRLRILRKTGLRSTGDLIRYALEQGFVR